MKPILGHRSALGSPYDVTAYVTVGSYTNIAPYSQMHGRTQHPCITNPQLVSSSSGRHIPDYPRSISDDVIVIGSDVWIGRNVVLLGSITIGHGAIIGAFSVVAKDIPPYAVVVGNPAQIIRYRFDAETIKGLLDIEWWNWPDDIIAERAEDLRDVRKLVAKYAYESP